MRANTGMFRTLLLALPERLASHRARDHSMNAETGQVQTVRPAPGSPHGTEVPDASGHSHLREMIGAASQSAIRALRSGGADEGREAPRAAFRDSCALARARGVRAEQLILMIRDGWHRLPELRGVSRVDADVTRARVVTLCIQEYYEPLDGS